MLEAVKFPRLSMRVFFVLAAMAALMAASAMSSSLPGGLGTKDAEAGTAGYQWSSCSSNGKQYAARIYWNSYGREYKMDFKSPYGSVKQVTLQGITSLKPAWMSIENLGSFAQSSYYSSRTIRSGWEWGWHRHWSGSNVLYQSALTVYLNDGNWTPDCTIHFYENSDRF
jgi:hypothetical protein